jgi:Arc/MetJ family transcription regulator
MRTTLNIDDWIFQDLLLLTAAKTKTEAVRTALTEYLRMKRKEKLLALRGKVGIDPDWQSLRQAELEEGESYAGRAD